MDETPETWAGGMFAPPDDQAPEDWHGGMFAPRPDQVAAEEDQREKRKSVADVFEQEGKKHAATFLQEGKLTQPDITGRLATDAPWMSPEERAATQSRFESGLPTLRKQAQFERSYKALEAERKAPEERASGPGISPILPSTAIGAVKRYPAIGSLTGLATAGVKYQAAKRMEAGTDTEEDRRTIANMVLDQKEEQARNPTLGDKILDTASYLPAFVTEWSMLGGVGGVSRKLATEALAKGYSKAGTTFLEDAAAKAATGRALSVAERLALTSVGAPAEGLARTIARPDVLAKKTLEGTAPQVTPDEQGGYQITPGKPLTTEAANALRGQFIENAVFSAGGPFEAKAGEKFIPRVLKGWGQGVLSAEASQELQHLGAGAPQGSALHRFAFAKDDKERQDALTDFGAQVAAFGGIEFAMHTYGKAKEWAAGQKAKGKVPDPEKFKQQMEDVANLPGTKVFRGEGTTESERVKPSPVQVVESNEPPPEAAPQPPAPVAEAPPAEAKPAEPPIAGYTTAKGSTYEVHEDGTTTRNKAARADVGHEGDQGAKERSEKTVYVSSDPSALSSAGQTGPDGKPPRSRVIIKDGKATLITWNEKEGRWGAAPSGREIPVSDKPAVGLHPLELWGKKDDIPGHEAYSKMHAGNKITEVKPAEPQTVPPVSVEPGAGVKEVTPEMEAAARQARDANNQYEAEKNRLAGMGAPETPRQTADRLEKAHNLVSEQLTQYKKNLEVAKGEQGKGFNRKEEIKFAQERAKAARDQLGGKGWTEGKAPKEGSLKDRLDKARIAAAESEKAPPPAPEPVKPPEAVAPPQVPAEAPSGKLTHEQLFDQLREGKPVPGLTEKQSKDLYDHHVLGKTLDEIGKARGVSREAIRQSVENALEAVHDHVEEPPAPSIRDKGSVEATKKTPEYGELQSNKWKRTDRYETALDALDKQLTEEIKNAPNGELTPERLAWYTSEQTALSDEQDTGKGKGPAIRRAIARDKAAEAERAAREPAAGRGGEPAGQAPEAAKIEGPQGSDPADTGHPPGGSAAAAPAGEPAAKSRGRKPRPGGRLEGDLVAQIKDKIEKEKVLDIPLLHEELKGHSAKEINDALLAIEKESRNGKGDIAFTTVSDGRDFSQREHDLLPKGVNEEFGWIGKTGKGEGKDDDPFHQPYITHPAFNRTADKPVRTESAGRKTGPGGGLIGKKITWGAGYVVHTGTIVEPPPTSTRAKGGDYYVQPDANPRLGEKHGGPPLWVSKDNGKVLEEAAPKKKGRKPSVETDWNAQERKLKEDGAITLGQYVSERGKIKPSSLTDTLEDYKAKLSPKVLSEKNGEPIDTFVDGLVSAGIIPEVPRDKDEATYLLDLLNQHHTIDPGKQTKEAQGQAEHAAGQQAEALDAKRARIAAFNKPPAAGDAAEHGPAGAPEQIEPGVMFHHEPIERAGFGSPLTEEEKATGMIAGGQEGTGATERPKREHALANAKVDEQRAERGAPPLMEAARRSNPEVWDRAMATLDRDPGAGAKLVEELADGSKKSTTVDENALLLQRQIALANEHERAVRDYVREFAQNGRLSPALDELEANEGRLARQIDQLDEVARKTGTEWGRAGQFRKQLATERYELSGMLQRAAAAKGEPLTPEEKVQITQLHDRIKELEKKLEETEGKVRQGKAGVKDLVRDGGNVEDAKGEYEKLNNENRKKREPVVDKVSDWLKAIRVNELISGIGTLIKVSAASASRLVTTPLEEASGAVLRRIPGLSKIAAAAPREGRGFNWKTEAKSFASFWSKGFADAWRTARTGKSELDSAHGKQGEPGSWLNLQFRIHDAIKAPAVRAEYTRSFLQRMDFYAARGEDISSPEALLRISTEAYVRSQEAKFRQQNWLVDSVNSALKIDPKGSTFQKVAKTGAKLLVPILRIPTNLVFETGTHIFGTATGSVQAINAYRRGIETLKPHEADAIMRQFKKGSLGLGMLLLGYFKPDMFGGYYQEDEKKKKGEPGFGEAQVGGATIPTAFQHNPMMQVAQFGATIRKVQDKQAPGKLFGVKKGPIEGVAAGVTGLASEIPLIREATDVEKMVNAHSRGAAFGELAKSFLVPQLFQWLAGQMDLPEDQHVPFGHPNRRKPQDFLETLETGIPGLRQRVGLKQ